MHNCMADPAKAPLIARQSLSRAGEAKLPRAASVAPKKIRAPAPYRLLPPITVRRFMRPRVRVGKRRMFSQAIAVLRKELYKPLPAGRDWPPAPVQTDLPRPEPARDKKKRTPQWVLDEWKGFHSQEQRSVLGFHQLDGDLDPGHLEALDEDPFDDMMQQAAGGRSTHTDDPANGLDLNMSPNEA